jgi:hypothetical protein
VARSGRRPAPRGGRARRALREVFLQLLMIIATLAVVELFLRIIDLRELGPRYAWMVAKVRILDFNLKFQPFGSQAPELMLTNTFNSCVLRLRLRERRLPGRHPCRRRLRDPRRRR